MDHEREKDDDVEEDGKVGDDSADEGGNSSTDESDYDSDDPSSERDDFTAGDSEEEDEGDEEEDEEDEGDEDEDEDSVEEDEGDEDESSDDAEEETEGDSEDPDENGDEEGRGESTSAAPDVKRKRPKIFQATLITLCALILLAYSINVYLNVTVLSEVQEHCWAENQRLADAINEATEDRLPALEWMVSLYRARRRYAREICDETVLQLGWWRWNIGRRIEADVSSHTQEEISRTLGRASLSCEHEIQTMDDLMRRELEARGSEAEVLARADEMIEGQLESCRELRSAIAESRPGFWPPLVANGQVEVPDRLRAMMPRALHAVSQSEEPSP